jgi:TetR/AcrR family transcriptional regulator, transcriptional repressor for nem operon
MLESLEYNRLMEQLTSKGERTRDSILSTAARLVHLNGVAGTSLSDVLTASGTGKSQMYHYFQNKDEMIHSVLAYRAEDFERRLAPMLRNLSSWQDVERWFAFVLEDQRSTGFVGGCPFGTMAAEVADKEESLRSELGTFFQRWIDHIAHGLQNLKGLGVLRKEAKPKDLAASILASLEGGMLLAKTLKSEQPLKAALDGSLLLLKGFATSKKLYLSVQ